MSEALMCTLPVDEADQRVRQTRSALGGWVRVREEIDGGMRLHFPTEPAIETTL